ncbi:hypothetical protein M446_2836 [Methylobacterium sp. 4-46]|uniref:hypothetical protein n=1 Tax=unclassified Methylobacterium TaxID=2615210 RepID=UPI000165C967|nr:MULTISPECIES: hypothetical protein [Methylobacterium]ACA17261.1 hypothetical protein M446_2836 [Methylobacterium sp. 4-46]WFT82947.1 hypothetical protein QA634_14380 [Methylobacterium nodulans]
MPMLFQALSLRSALVALTSGCLMLATAGHVRAGEEEGLGLLFHNLIGARPAPQPGPTLQPSGSGAESYPAHQRRAWRQSGRRAWLREPRAQIQPKPKARYAALPRPEKLRQTVGRPAPRPKLADNAALLLPRGRDPGAALLRDATLRRGDVVITAQGPGVFTGKEGDQHRAGDFEDAERSSSLDRRTRKLLAAMVAPAGARCRPTRRAAPWPSHAGYRLVSRRRPRSRREWPSPRCGWSYPGAALNTAARARDGRRMVRAWSTYSSRLHS